MQKSFPSLSANSPFSRWLSPCLPLFFAVALLGTACSHERGPDLRPLEQLATSGAGEVDNRLQKAKDLLRDELLPHPRIATLFGTLPTAPGNSPSATPEEDIPWSRMPFIAVGVLGVDGALAAALPRASDTVGALLLEAGRTPASSDTGNGDLQMIPNTSVFTLGIWAASPGGGRLSALLDVDDAFTAGVLTPLARAAHGLAFLADRNGHVVLASHPSLVAVPLERLGIPLPDAAPKSIAGVDIGGVLYHVAVARAATNGWIVGVATPDTAAPAVPDATGSDATDPAPSAAAQDNSSG